MFFTRESGGTARHLYHTKKCVHRIPTIMVERGKFALRGESIDKRAHRGDLSLRKAHGRWVVLLVTATMMHVGFIGYAEDRNSSFVAGVQTIVLNESMSDLLVSCSYAYFKAPADWSETS